MKKFLLAFVAFFLCLSSFAKIEVKDGANDSWNDEVFSEVSVNPGFTSSYAIMAKVSPIDVQVEGVYNITFTYGGVGSYALHMLGVELLDAEGNVISKDYHYGEAGNAPKNNVYTIVAVSEATTIRYYAENYKPIDSQGTIAFALSEANANEWKPEYWKTVGAADVSADVQAVHEAFEVVDNKSYVKKMDAFLSLEKGMHTFDFNYLSGASSLRIGAVELLELDGDVVCGDYHYGQSGLASSTFDSQYSLNVLKSGKYIVRYYCSNKSAGNNSKGTINITSIPCVNADGGVTNWAHITGNYVLPKDMSAPFYTMEEEDVPAGILALSNELLPSDIRVAERLVTVSETSLVNVEFEYEDGKMALNLAGVDFVDAEGKVVASHYKTYNENSSVVSKYALAPVEPGTYTMRCFVQLSSENHNRKIDSKGTIKLTRSSLGDVINASENSVNPELFGWTSTTFVNADTVPQSIADAGSKRVRVVKRIIDVEEGNDFVLKIFFKWEGTDGGNHSLDVAGVDIIDAHGKVFASDYHFESYGSQGNERLYKLNIKTPGRYILRIFNGQENANTRVVNSYGNVLLSVQKKVFEATSTDLSKYYYYIKGENGKYVYAKSGNNATLVDKKENASKFYFEKNGDVYNLISFEAGLYMDLSGSTLATADVGNKTNLSLGKGFLSGESVVIKAGDNYLTDELALTTSIYDNVSWNLEKVESLSFSISTLRHASLCLPVEVRIPDDVKVYTLGGINIDQVTGTGTLELNRIYDYIPANEPVVLYSAMPLDATTSFDFEITDAGAKLSGENLFDGVYVKSRISASADKIYYILTKPAGMEVGFYNVNVTDNAFVLGANKMYFSVDKTVAASLARGLSMSFRDTPATGVDEVLVSDGNVEGVYYDLMGRKVEDITVPGLYIVNGKKVLVK